MATWCREVVPAQEHRDHLPGAAGPPPQRWTYPMVFPSVFPTEYPMVFPMEYASSGYTSGYTNG